MFYFDDLCHHFPSTIETFQRHVLVNDTFEEPILQSFRDNLTDTYRFWDSIPANCIILSAMEYFNGCALEERPTIRDMKLLDTAESWPYYLRNKTGVAAAYAFMIYPKDRNSDVSAYIQAMGDMCFFINVVNDLLSFHKEQLAGETNNYVHVRARITRKSIQDTLHDVAKESSAAHARITKILQFTDGATAWKRFVDGYLTLHLTQSRFRLNELGF
ncbi:hypothetical protein GALMADRAFT_73695 [Galerina marginata CBS 339.88]|uniref:Terpene synthase n=1 Tax=Galerina marginata (strain CBS 339.88) TaxID=685588 RepID=A0A067T0H3_GALM3|nr:hypothetical protein GALMADRAFT_73695 [Galerina marginata CBS 339.88]